MSKLHYSVMESSVATELKKAGSREPAFLFYYINSCSVYRYLCHTTLEKAIYLFVKGCYFA